MRIVCFLPELGGGGAQRTLINVVNSLAESGGSAALCVANGQGPAKAWLAPDARLIDLNVSRVRAAVFPLSAQIKRERPDVVLASGVDANIVAWLATILAGASRPRLILRETNSHRARGDLGVFRRLLVGLAYRSADRVVALSHGVRDELIQTYGLDPGRIVTIHNPVKIDEIGRKAHEARKQARPWSKSGPTIMGIGRLTRQKGFERLIAATAALPDKSVELVILGEGEDRDKLTLQARRLGLGDRVLMPGFDEHPERWLAHADVFALPSRWEGFGHVIVEAMASEVPVVAFDCPYGPRDIIRDQVDGLLVPEGDTEALVAAIRRALEDEDLAMRLRQNGLAAALRYSDKKILQTYLDLFRAVLAGDSTRSRHPASKPSIWARPD